MTEEQELEQIVLHRVENQLTYNKMKERNLIEEDQLYFVKEEDLAAILYTPQELTYSQKLTARQNIGITGTGKDGKTPIKGQDYFTESDKEEIIAAILSRLSNAQDGEF